jgi:DsbC/DsbD-like thiol-disulfide interchange protein
MKKFVLLLSLLPVATVLAQTPGTVQWDASAQPAPGRDGVVIANVTAKIEKGWHVYAQTQSPGGPIPLRVAIESGAPYELAGAITATKPLTHHDSSFDLDTQFYTESFFLKVPVKATAGAQPGIPLTVRFQMCSDTTCMPSKTVHLLATQKSPTA